MTGGGGFGRAEPPTGTSWRAVASVYRRLSPEARLLARRMLIGWAVIVIGLVTSVIGLVRSHSLSSAGRLAHLSGLTILGALIVAIGAASFVRDLRRTQRLARSRRE